MKLVVNKRSGKYIDTIEVPDEATLADLKHIFFKTHHYYPERQWWNVTDWRGAVIRDGSLKESGVKDGSVLVFKDLGVQISWRLVFVLEYFGPLFLFPFFFYFPGIVYGSHLREEKSLVQKAALWLAIFHYAKREFETLFVHRFSAATMPIVRVPLNCGHYWILFGVLVGYFVFHPLYTPPWADVQKPIIYGLSALMIAFELLNFRTHLILRSLRPRGTKERGLPRGWGFGLVSCANYLWETSAWVVFCILTQTLTGYVFTLVAFVQMADWALKKHRNYKKQFDDYPK
eukprot:GHVT01095441.1.p1 GENE.GHVT01095441.1~~GHVT01095441.1.p1  ORF type:complete len:288 (+),score=23.29 GHVT01095441.1:636-1499(+)